MGPLGIGNSQLPCSNMPCQLSQGHGQSRRPWMVTPVQARFIDQRQVCGNGPHQLCRIHLHGGSLVTVQLARSARNLASKRVSMPLQLASNIKSWCPLADQQRCTSKHCVDPGASKPQHDKAVPWLWLLA